MSLTAAQKADCRRFAGWPMLGDFVASDVNDPVLGNIATFTFETLEHRLNTLRAEEEAILVTKYLDVLPLLEDAIVAAGDNLDTDAASVWTHNKREVAERTALFNAKRREMCDTLGMPYGPGLGDGQMTLIRG